MEQDTLIFIDDSEKYDASAVANSFAHKDTKNRVYINTLGAELAMKYLISENINVSNIRNIHSIKKVLEELDIADIMLSNIHIDVRVVFDENAIFIPKSHFEYNFVPDVYFVFELAKDHSHVKFLGFFEPKLINKNNANDKYYFIEKEKLNSPLNLKTFIENFSGSTTTGLSQEDIEKSEQIMVSMADNDITEEDKKYLIKQLSKSIELRDKFLEYENFETLSAKAFSSPEIIKPDHLDTIEDFANETVDEPELNFDEISIDETNSEIADEPEDFSDDTINFDEIEETISESDEETISEPIEEAIEESIEDETTSLDDFETVSRKQETFDEETISLDNIDENIIESEIQENTEEAANESFGKNLLENLAMEEQIMIDGIDNTESTTEIEELPLLDTLDSVPEEITQQASEEIIEAELLTDEDSKTDEINEINEINNTDKDISSEINELDELASIDEIDEIAQLENIEDIVNTSESIEEKNNAENNLTDESYEILTEINNIIDSAESVQETKNIENYVEELPVEDAAAEYEHLEDDAPNNIDALLTSNETEELGVLYSENEPNIPTANLEEQPIQANKKDNKKLLMAGAATLTIIAVFAAVNLMKPKDNAANNLEEITPEENVLASQPENNIDTNIETNIPDIKPSDVKNTQQIKPASDSTYLNVNKLVWDVPDSLSYSTKMQNYLRTAGKSIKLSLSADLLLATEYAYTNQVKVGLKLSNDGAVQDAKILAGSGSNQIDKIILQCVKDTLNVVKPPAGEVKTPNFNLNLIIYL